MQGKLSRLESINKRKAAGEEVESLMSDIEKEYGDLAKSNTTKELFLVDKDGVEQAVPLLKAYREFQGSAQILKELNDCIIKGML